MNDLKIRGRAIRSDENSLICLTDIWEAAGFKVSDNLRDKMSLPELTYIMAAESLANERIEETDPRGATRCQVAVRTSATFIREAIEKDRASRGKPTFG
jgi:hypothetical protein